MTIDLDNQGGGRAVLVAAEPAEAEDELPADCLPPTDRDVPGERADPCVACRRSAAQFGGKHHTTVLHSINKIEQLRHTDADLNRMIHSLIDSFQLDLLRFPQDTPTSGVCACGSGCAERDSPQTGARWFQQVDVTGSRCFLYNLERY